MSEIHNETIRDDTKTVTERELQPILKQLEQQNRLLSLQLSAPAIASLIEARQSNIEKRATQIFEFKKATPKP